MPESLSSVRRVLMSLCCLTVLSIVLTACQSDAGVTPFAVTLPPTRAAVALATAVPSNTPRPTNTATLTFTPTFTVTTSATPTLTDTAPPTATLEPSLTPTPARVEHFFLARPIAPGGIDYVDRNYPYGSTQLKRYPVHHGVEFQNPRGTPVLAAAPGTVYYAGEDAETLFGPQLDYYGRLVIIQHDFPTPDGLPAFTLYGHLDRINVTTGQTVEAGDKVGAVGDSGIAVGPHLHFEVRVGEPENFYATRNPELWLVPYPAYGVLAGRVVTPDGALLPEVVVKVKPPDRPNTALRYAYSYESDSVNGDSAWGENFTLGDLPEGAYEVFISDRNGKIQFETVVNLVPGKITWVEIVLDAPPVSGVG